MSQYASWYNTYKDEELWTGEAVNDLQEMQNNKGATVCHEKNELYSLY